MICKKRILLIFLLTLFVINITACNKKQQSKETQLNIYVDTKDNESLDILKIVSEEYKKSNSKVKLNINNAIGGKIEEDISKGGEGDIIITSRNNMIKLSEKGLLSDMGNYFDENKIDERYYTAVKAYGRFNDKYYGIPLMPYTLETLYNQSAFDKLGVKAPSAISEVKDLFKKVTSSGKRIPVIIGKDIDTNSLLFSIIVNNTMSMRKLESVYNSGAAAYKSLTEMQQAFDTLGQLITLGGINKDTFELGNESSINKFIKGDIPLIICSSYYASNFKDEDIKVLGDKGLDSQVKLNVPIISNSIICVPSNNKNGEEVTSFIKFALGDEMQKKLSDKGFVTGNKKINNTKDKGVRGAIIQHFESSTEDSVAYIYNIPKKLADSISSKIDEMLSGKQSKKEWQEAVEESYS